MFIGVTVPGECCCDLVCCQSQDPQNLLVILCWWCNDPHPMLVCSPCRHVVVCGEKKQNKTIPWTWNFATESVRPKKKQEGWLISIFFSPKLLFVSQIIVSVTYMPFIWEAAKYKVLFIPSALSILVKFCGQELVCSVFFLTYLSLWFMWHLVAWTHAHTHKHTCSLAQVHIKVLRCLSHMALGCVFNLDRSFSRLKEKFLFGVVNPQSTVFLCAMAHCQISAHWDNYGDIS